MSVSWKDFANQVQPWCPGAPWYLVEDALREAARDLCRFAGVWEEDVLDLTTIANQQSYQLVPQNDYAEVYKPVEVRYLPAGETNWDNAATVRFATKPWLDGHVSGWRSRTGTSVSKYTSLARGSIELIEIPSVAGAQVDLKVRATLIPAADSTLTDDSLLNWGMAIAHNARWRLLNMPKKGWTDQKSAAGEFRMWMAQRANALFEKQRQMGTAELRAEPLTKWGSR